MGSNTALLAGVLAGLLMNLINMLARVLRNDKGASRGVNTGA